VRAQQACLILWRLNLVVAWRRLLTCLYRDGQQFEIWTVNLSDPVARELLQNMEVLVPMFIEGGSMLQLEQDWTTQRWTLFLLYAIRPKPKAGPTYSPYSLLGYGTSYRIFSFPDRTTDLNTLSSAQTIYDFLPRLEIESDEQPSSVGSPLDLPSRERLSQFLILPPYQGEGHGQELYNTMYRILTTPNNIYEFTVEDPNEAFDDLRDLCDLINLRRDDGDFCSLKLHTDIPSDQLVSMSDLPTDLIVPIATRDAIRKRTKLMPRQFDRLVEMHTLSQIPKLSRNRNRTTRKEKSSNPDDKAYYFWRLYTKRRLFLFNLDQLAQLERQVSTSSLKCSYRSSPASMAG
jgi:histone acetyltransferase 1